MKFNKLLLLAALASVAAGAEEIQFEGRTLDVGGDEAASPILRMSGSRYAINASSAQILDKARACLSRSPAASSAVVDGSVLSADVHAEFRVMFSSRSIRSRIAIEAADGHFNISQSDFGYSPAALADTPDGGYSPLLHSGPGWDNALETAIKVEDDVVDCLYR